MRETPADRNRCERARDLGADFVGEDQDIPAMAPSMATATTTAPSSFLIPQRVPAPSPIWSRT